uniref:Uncharacterized protein n=1 Tax=Meloidogyne enterolobii TaxID=390850 RepID=A0A6V7W6U2_MELEN|nr:unnamed protein product [Meloidogyne enterolobii]
MFFCFDDGSGTKKASTTLRSATTILPMFFASTLVVFVLLGQVDSEKEYNGPIGFFKHTLKDGQVTLANDSKAVEAGDDYNLEKYTNHSGSCDVEVKENGNIVLYYKRKNGKNIKDEGCTVDLFTKHSNMIKFRTGVKNKTAGCLKNCSGHIFDGASANLIPFAYSLKGINITEIKNRSRFGKGQDCVERCGDGNCMEWTSLEVGWNRCFYKTKRQVIAHTHPIGESLAKWNRSKMFNKFNEFELTITGQGGFYMDESEGYNPDDAEENQPACVPKGKGIFKPSNWKIIGRNPAPEHGHLLVFYMLPQNASRNHSKGDITDKSPDGPNCEELYIEFDKQNYTLLSVGDPPTTTTTTTTTTTRPTTTTTTASTTTKSTPPAVKTTERTTTTTEKPIYRSNDFWFAVARGGFPAGIMLSCFCLIMVFCCEKRTTRFCGITCLMLHAINLTIFALIALGVFFVYTKVNDPSPVIVLILIPSLTFCCMVSTCCIVHKYYKYEEKKLEDQERRKRQKEKEEEKAARLKHAQYKKEMEAVIDDYLEATKNFEDINPEVLEHAKKAQKLGPRQMPLPPYCSVGISTISDRPKVDRKEDTATANSLMAATETSKIEAAEHSKMGGNRRRPRQRWRRSRRWGRNQRWRRTKQRWRPRQRWRRSRRWGRSRKWRPLRIR